MRSQTIVLAMLLLAVVFQTTAVADTVDIGASHDAQVVEGYPTNNYGSNTSLYLASAGSGSYLDERVWVKFDLAGHLPPGAVITSARLRLYCWRADDNSDLETSVFNSADDGWDESTITWNTQPVQETLLSSATLNANDPNRWYEWDVTSSVQSQWAGDQVTTFMVRATDEGADPSVTYAFDGKEYSTTLAPRLRIEYTGTWPTGSGFKIFHMNDVHSRLLPHEFDFPGSDDMPVFEQAGGAAYFTSRMLALKSADPDSLILDAGDMSEGSPLGDLRGNGGMVDFYNLLDQKLKALSGRGIDAAVVGNHDVRSLEMLTNLRDDTDFPCISVNICNEGTQTPYFSPYVIVTVNGTKVGILGYTNDESSYLGADTENVIDIVKCVWDDNDAATINIKDRVEELRDTEGCDVVILLSHMGHSRITSGDDAVLADIGGVLPPEVVISGHWHTWTDTAWQPAQLNYKTTIAEAASYLQYIGELEVTGYGKYVHAQKHPIRNSDISPDTDVEALIATLTEEYNSASPAHPLDEVIGYSAVDLTMDKDKWWTVSEYPWNATNTAGAWITDAMKWKADDLGHTVHMAFQSGGGIRRDIQKGWITYREIYEAYPWSDDAMVRITIPGSEIIDFIQKEHCGVSISDGLMVTAQDGIISRITLNGTPIDSGTDYTVLISQYMYEHEYPWSDPAPVTVTSSIREAVVDYTTQFSDTNPMQVDGPRYNLDTELAGGFTAVVTMTADSEREPYYEDGFIRLLSALPAATQRRAYYGLTDLVNSDGSINTNHPFAEVMLYRSYLGLKEGLLKNGDIIEIWAEGGFHDGNSQLVEQEGIQGDGIEFKIVGHDTSLAQPDYQPGIDAFMDEDHENRYVRFYAEKTADNQVTDSQGTSLTVYYPGAYYTMTLPGNVGDILELTGVQTQESETTRRFRCHTAAVSSASGYLPTSVVDEIFPSEQSAASITLTATASDYVEGASGSVFAQTSFEEPVTFSGVKYTDTGSAGADHALSNNSGEPPVNYTASGGELGFSAYYTNTRSDVGLTDGDYVGVTDYTTTVGSYPHGSQGYQISDADGKMTVTLDTVNLSAQPNVTLSMNYFVAQTSYEADDIIRIWVTVDGGAELDLLNTSGSDIDDLGIEGAWQALTRDLSGYTQATVHFEMDCNAAAEAVYVDNIQFSDSGSHSGDNLAQVAFYYRYAADGMNWSIWNSAGSADTSAPWELTFNYPDGEGYYQFYSVATDDESNNEAAPVTADTHVRFISGANTVPNPATNAGVADGATDQAVNQLLTVAVNDGDHDFVDVCFYTGSGEQIDCVDNVGSGQNASVFWLGLEEGTQYDWYVVVDDGIDATQSDTWDFTTLNAAPDPVPVPAVNHAVMAAVFAALLLLAAHLIGGKRA